MTGYDKVVKLDDCRKDRYQSDGNLALRPGPYARRYNQAEGSGSVDDVIQQGAMLPVDPELPAVAVAKAEDLPKYISGVDQLRQTYIRFLEREGNKLSDYLTSQGLSERPLSAYINGDLADEIIAAVLVGDRESLLIYNQKHLNNDNGTAKQVYALVHETVHRHGVSTETECDYHVAQYAMRKAAKAGTKSERNMWLAIQEEAVRRYRTGECGMGRLQGIKVDGYDPEQDADQDADQDSGQEPSSIDDVMEE